MSDPTDRLYAEQRDSLVGFRFDSTVAAVFPDMIQRSVPGYSTIVHMIGQIAARYAQPHSQLYDLGCSLGAATLAMSDGLARSTTSPPGIRIIAVDNSADMLARCRQHIDASATQMPIELVCADLQRQSIERASVCVLNFTLQFVPLAERDTVIRRIADGMLPGGVLILSEKIAFDDREHQTLMTELHHNFKRANGYSDLEIAQKRSALENVLIPETLNTHRQRIINAGFRTLDCWFQCFNFASIIAFK